MKYVLNKIEIEYFFKWKREAGEMEVLIQFGRVMFYIPGEAGFNLKDLTDFLEENAEWVLSTIDETKNMFLVKRTRHELFLLLTKYVNRWEKIMHVKSKRLRITEKPMKCAWANCSKTGYLTFSVECLELPRHILELLVIHELTHITVGNHSESFWREYEKYVPEARELDQEINMYVDLEEELKVYVEEEV